MTLAVEGWKSSQSYREAKYLAKSLNVVHDDAERCVKLARDHVCDTKKEDNYRNLLQSVEHDIDLMPNLRK